MEIIVNSDQSSLRRDMAGLLSTYTHDATNPLINLESLIQYLQRQSVELKVAIADGHAGNITHLIDKGLPQTIEMMLTSSQQMRDMNKALNQLYHCHCDDLQDEPVDLNVLLKEVIEGQDTAENIHIRVAVLPSIIADKAAMKIIFTALVSNAVNSIYSEQGGKIDIGVDQTSVGYCFHIKDDGCGLMSEEIKKIDTPFYRGIKSKGDGLGIGLSMAQALIARHKGCIDCESTINQGTTFTFTWPVHEFPNS